MSRKKKIILFTIVSLILIFSGLWYTLWSTGKNKKMVLQWIKNSNGVHIEDYDHDWIGKWPSFMQDSVKKLVGKEIIAIDFVGAGAEHLKSIKDISIIKNLSSLRVFNIEDTEVSDISVIKHLKSLEYLKLSGTRIKDISALSKLTKLEGLFLSNTDISDISALKDLKNLEELELIRTNVSDVSVLQGLKKLKEVNLYVSPVSLKQVNELKKSFPGSVIHSNFNKSKTDNIEYINSFLGKKFPRLKFNGMTSPEELLLLFQEETSMSRDITYQSPISFCSYADFRQERKKHLNLDFEDITYGEIIQIFCKLGKLHYKIEKHAVKIYSSKISKKTEMNKIPIRENIVKDQLELIIPKIRFKDRELEFVLDFIKRKSREVSPDKQSLNLLSTIVTDGKINLDRDDISVKEVLDKVCEQLNISYEVESNVVIIGH